VIGDPIVLELYVRIFSERPPPPTCAVVLGKRGGVALLFELVKAGAKHPESGCPVLYLALLVLHRHNEPGWQMVMRTAESVVLTDCPPGSSRTVDVDAEVAWLDLDLDLVGSGRTFTVADEVWTRPWDSVTGMRLHPVSAGFL